MDSDDSQVDIFATQIQTKKKHFQTSSGPACPGKRPSDLMYSWLIIFRWGGDIDVPFDLMSVDDLKDGELDPKFISGLLTPMSRLRHRNLAHYSDFSVSIFGKMEKSKQFKKKKLYTNKLCIILIPNRYQRSPEKIVH